MLICTLKAAQQRGCLRIDQKCIGRYEASWEVTHLQRRGIVDERRIIYCIWSLPSPHICITRRLCLLSSRFSTTSISNKCSNGLKYNNNNLTNILLLPIFHYSRAAWLVSLPPLFADNEDWWHHQAGRTGGTTKGPVVCKWVRITQSKLQPMHWWSYGWNITLADKDYSPRSHYVIINITSSNQTAQ